MRPGHFFEDNTFDYIFSEHMIEHVDHDGAVAMLRECYRVLKPGGTICMATPDLAVIVGLLARTSLRCKKGTSNGS
jgi:predicted SAM-dependent methyltransferase